MFEDEQHNQLILKTLRELNDLNARREVLLEKLKDLYEGNYTEEIEDLTIEENSRPYVSSDAGITKYSPGNEKIQLFMNLFRGREDVFPRRFESVKTGKSGYQPVCSNEWVEGICEKPRVKCGVCMHRILVPLDTQIIRNHLSGAEDYSHKDFVIGVYPLLKDNSCWFLAIDFDKASWIDDTRAFMNTCFNLNIPASLERSRSGKGGHIWIFFSDPIQAEIARNLGFIILNETMEAIPELGFESFDRLFPNQDVLPKKGFGNLIALPLQKKPRKAGNSVFIDENGTPYTDQWIFLSSITRMSSDAVEHVIANSKVPTSLKSYQAKGLTPSTQKPGESSTSLLSMNRMPEGPFPASINLVQSNLIYIEKKPLSKALINRFIRMAAFQNPEFHKKQAMRFPTWGIPRVINCSEIFPEYIALPRGCLDQLMAFCKDLEIDTVISDDRFFGLPLDVKFHGTLRVDQAKAAEKMLLYDTGVLSASTGFGKTVIAAFLIAKRMTNTLVLVHRKSLLTQWMNQLKLFLNLEDSEVGQFGGGKRETSGLIDVAMIQSIYKKGILEDMIMNYGHIIVDECHHISAPSFEQVLRSSKARYVTGLSATVIRKDGHHPIIFFNCGPVRHRVDDKKQAEIRPFTHLVKVRTTALNLPSRSIVPEQIPIHEIFQHLVHNESRNEMIAEDVKTALEDGRSPIVLTERIAHLKLLEMKFSALTNNLIILKGGMGKKATRLAQERLQTIPANEPRIILATGKYIGEGFDDPRCDTLFLTFPISWKGTVSQYAGRLHRRYDTKKEVIIYDYHDENIAVLSVMHRRRKKGYRAIGYEVLKDCLI